MICLPALSMGDRIPGKSLALGEPSICWSFISKLENFAPLASADRTSLVEMTNRQRKVEAQSDIVREGDPHGPLRVILDGWACRYKQLGDGRRQITAILLPGDLCDTHVNVLSQMDHSIAAITPVTLAEIPRPWLDGIVGRHPQIGAALWWDMLAACSIQREWMVNLGQRDAGERLGHLFCELFHRLRAVGLTRGRACDMPLRQMDLAAITGVTSVHVNRCLQALRMEGLIVLKHRRLVIPDLAALRRAALFNPAYLHLGSGHADHPVGARML